MKFIHFGCWNRGKCNLLEPNIDPVSTVIASIKRYIESEDVKPTFLTVAGDNYYPLKEAGYKVHNYEDLKSGFDCLDELDNIDKYILFGNHEYNDVYPTNRNILYNPFYQLDNVNCVNLISQQKLLSGNDKYKLFDNVLHKYDDVTKTLVIMIDTTFYDKKPNMLCYDHVFKSSESAQGRSIETLKSLQLDQVKNIIRDKEFTKIIFIGHHPIVYCKNKNENKIINKVDPLIDFFNNLKELIFDKKIIYLCADTHFYQKGNIKLINSNLNIEQHIVGTGGASCDNICKSEEPTKHIAGILKYDILDEKQEYGYLIYQDESITFQLVPYENPEKQCLQEGGGNKRKYKINYN